MIQREVNDAGIEEHATGNTLQVHGVLRPFRPPNDRASAADGA